MDRRQLPFGMSALAVGSPSLNDLLAVRSVEAASQSTGTYNGPYRTAKRHGLRGRVKTCVEGPVRRNTMRREE